MAATPRQVGEPGKKVCIRLTADDATAEAERLIREGGECNRYAVYEAITQLLGDGEHKNLGLCFYREGEHPVEIDYHHFYCAVTENMEIREKAKADRQFLDSFK